jgi:hypothetical protein
MTIAPAQIVNYTLLDLHKFYSQVETYLQWGEFDWYMNCAHTTGKLNRHVANECCLSARQTRTITGAIRTTYRIDGRIFAKRNIGQELYDRGAVGVLM